VIEYNYTISKDNRMVENIEAFEESLLSLDRIQAKEILTQEPDTALFEALETVVVPTMESIGQKWEEGEVALSQVYMSGKICEEIVEELLPLDDETRIEHPNIAIMVYRDFHMLGKRIVLTFLRASGYKVSDYGHQESIDEIIKRIKSDKIEILLISVLMLNSALHLKELTDAIKAANLSTKVVVGGAPFRFDTHLYQEVGADAFGKSASDIIDIIDTLKAK